jgi:hypothetical protein
MSEIQTEEFAKDFVHYRVMAPLDTGMRAV